MNLELKIIELLQKTEPMKSAEIATALNVEKADVDKAIKVLKKDERVISPKMCFYSVQK